MDDRSERILAEDEVLEGEVLTNTRFVLRNPRSGLRYCTLGKCVVEQADDIQDLPEPDKPFVQHCALNGATTDIAELWSWASTLDDAGHLAMP